MCGIAGWIEWENNEITNRKAIVERMSQSLRHRGPDDGGCWLSNPVTLVHRRLSVIDLDGGSQPMVRSFSNNTYALIYNGEIYNYRELRSELQAKGHRFLTESDTEVLLVAYIEWGVDCLRRLAGIFAFALWDEANQELILARDPLGVKPLFYAAKDACFVFGSEIKALLQHPLVSPEIDTEGLAEIFALGPIRTPGHGVFRGVNELRPGQYAKVGPDEWRIYSYWSLVSQPHPDDIQTTVTRVRMLLEEVSRSQLVADVPISTLLSGGLDSSGLTALAAKEFPTEPIQTYSIDFVDSAANFTADAMHHDLDRPWAHRVAQYLHTAHCDVIVDTSDLIKHVSAPYRGRDLPGRGEAETSLFLLFQAMKPHATVAISGEGADELFGGYPWYDKPEALGSTTFPWSPLRDRKPWLSASLLHDAKLEAYEMRRYTEALEEVPSLHGDTPEQARIRRLSYLNLTRFLPYMLDRKDRMSMAVGLEVRVPFCDHRLVEYVFNVPWDMKNVSGHKKGLLKEAWKGLLPSEVIHRKKSSYPFIQNPSYLEAVRKMMVEILYDPSSPLQPFVNRPALLSAMEKPETIADHPLGITGWIRILDYFLQVDRWLREYRVRIL